MDGKLRNMTAIYLFRGEKVLLLYRQGGKVVDRVWTGSAGGHFEKDELNDAKACILREMQEEIGLYEEDIEGITLRYITLRHVKGEIRQNYYFFAELKGHVSDSLSSTEGILKWFSINEIDTLEMPFTAKYVMQHYRNEGYKTKNLYAGIAELNTLTFLSIR